MAWGNAGKERAVLCRSTRDPSVTWAALGCFSFVSMGESEPGLLGHCHAFQKGLDDLVGGYAVRLGFIVENKPMS